MMIDEKLRELGVRYGVLPRAFLVDGVEEFDQRIFIHNLYGLLTNEEVAEKLDAARTAIFNEEEYLRAISCITYEVGIAESRKRDYSSLCSFSAMQLEINKYLGLEPTPESSTILNSMKKNLARFKTRMAELEVLPLIYGSLRYGDAGHYSDIDIVYLTSGTEAKEINQLVANIDGTLDELFDGKHQNRDRINPHEMVYDLNEIQAILRDIEERQTDCIEDYRFKNTNLFPYNWILEGKKLFNGRGEVDSELRSTLKKLKEVRMIDPFFDFILCYNMYYTLEKRRKNMKRRKLNASRSLRLSA